MFFLKKVKMLKKYSLDREFYKTFIKLAVPIAFQNLMGSTLNMVDTVMVGQLGKTAIAAVGLGNQVFFLLNLLLFGICSGAAIFSSQFWGKDDRESIHKVLGLNLILGVGGAFLFTFASVLFPQQILSIFSTDPEVIRLGGQFLRISALSYIPMAVTFSFAFALRSTGEVKLPMVTSIIALSVNTVLNYLLIFGIFGLPVMGVRGSATATMIARSLEVVIIVTAVYKNKLPIAAPIKELFDISRDFAARFFKTTLPAIANECLWALGVTMYSVVYARMGTEVIASVNIATTVERIASVLFFGMAHASAVMIGNLIGAKDKKTAYNYAKRILIIGPTIGAITGVVLISFIRPILSIFNVDEQVRTDASRILLAIGLLLAIKAFNTIMMVGVFRSGGDTKFTLIMETAGIWLIAVPAALIGGLVLKLPVEWVYLLIAIEEVYKLIMGIKRFASKKWIKDLVNKEV